MCARPPGGDYNPLVRHLCLTVSQLPNSDHMSLLIIPQLQRGILALMMGDKMQCFGNLSNIWSQCMYFHQ